MLSQEKVSTHMILEGTLLDTTYIWNLPFLSSEICMQHSI